MVSTKQKRFISVRCGFELLREKACRHFPAIVLTQRLLEHAC
jgi:Fe-S-cluster containining protein